MGIVRFTISDSVPLRSDPLQRTKLENQEIGLWVGALKITSTVLKGRSFTKILAPVLVTILWTSLVFSRKIIASTGLYRCCTPDASAPVVAINESPIGVRKKRLFWGAPLGTIKMGCQGY